MTDKNRSKPAWKIENLKKALLPISESVPGLTRKTAKELAGPCPWCGGKDRFVVFVEENRFFCRQCKRRGDTIDIHCKIEGLDVSGLIQKYLGPNCDTPDIKITGRYEYLDPAGELLYWKEKIEPGRNGRDKEFFFSHGDHEKGRGCEPVLYNLPEVLKAKTIIITEGEKHADLLKEWGLAATSLDSGAQSKLTTEMIEQLAGKSIVILRDNDDPGLAYAENIATAIHGRCESLKVVLLPGLPEKGDILDWIKVNGNDKERLLQIIRDTPEWEPKIASGGGMATSRSLAPWENARSLFPKQTFPWHVLPEGIAKSLQQLARSCATSPVALPGVSFAVMSSVLGSTIGVSPKSSWSEPLIFWMADIRPSGDGKTPSARALCKVLYDEQQRVDAEYQNEYDEWRSLPGDARGDAPEKARGYYTTDLTLEGLRDDISGHGGTVAILDEASSFVSAQNQYKSKGNDRESWLALHDGNPCRVVRSSGPFTIPDARVSIFGGVQPEVWRKTFGGDDGLYMIDGTIFRFLATYEGSHFYELTKETWGDDNRNAWERTLKSALEWADERIESPEWKSLQLCLDDDAQSYFFNWRNDLYGHKPELPQLLQGYIPKIVGYALRLAGILHCMDVFSKSKTPEKVLTRADVEKGVETALFYLGHITNAAEALCAKETCIEVGITEQVKHLAQTLESLKTKLDSGRLAVGYIHERYNQDCAPEIKLSNPKAMGSFLRSCELTILEGYFTANGRRTVKCLQWDEKTESLINRVRDVRDVCKPCADEISHGQTSKEECSPCLSEEDSPADISTDTDTTSAPEDALQAEANRHIDHSDQCSDQPKDEYDEAMV